MATIDTIDTQLPIGYVKTITSDSGSKIQYVELSLSEETKVKMMYDQESNSIQFCAEDNNFNTPELICLFDKSTLKDLITALKNMYLQLK